jgi:hypothetical protein
MYNMAWFVWFLWKSYEIIPHIFIKSYSFVVIYKCKYGETDKTNDSLFFYEWESWIDYEKVNKMTSFLPIVFYFF